MLVPFQNRYAIKKTNDVSKLINFIFSVILTELWSSKFYVAAIYVRQWLPVWLIPRTLHVGGIMWLVSYAISYLYVFLTDSLPGRVDRGNREESYSSGWNFHDGNDWTVDSKSCLCLYVYQLAFIIFFYFLSHPAYKRRYFKWNNILRAR